MLLVQGYTYCCVGAPLGHLCAHIMCHGILELEKPFSFELHRVERLQLLDIVRSHFPDAEFTFLTTCHTAELTKVGIADEVLHLATTMQFCGFRRSSGRCRQWRYRLAGRGKVLLRVAFLTRRKEHAITRERPRHFEMP